MGTASLSQLTAPDSNIELSVQGEWLYDAAQQAVLHGDFEAWDGDVLGILFIRRQQLLLQLNMDPDRLLVVQARATYANYVLAMVATGG
ncbi:hypothetical protein MD484_g2438, partial [Candolleomyces efflorescens]